MANEKYKPQVPDIMEAIFDAGYLTHSSLFRELSEQFTEATTKSKGNSDSACRFPQSQ